MVWVFGTHNGNQICVGGWEDAALFLPLDATNILYEQGWIDPTKVTTPRHSRYSKDGRNSNHDFDDEGELMEEGKKYYMTHQLENCQDFQKQDKKTDLEHLATELSKDHIADTIRIPFHTKLSLWFGQRGDWILLGHAKWMYQQKKPLTKKRWYKLFMNLIHHHTPSPR